MGAGVATAVGVGEEGGAEIGVEVGVRVGAGAGVGVALEQATKTRAKTPRTRPKVFRLSAVGRFTVMHLLRFTILSRRGRRLDN